MTASEKASGTAHLKDVTAMRVLAHPTRLRLLGLLRTQGAQTAAMLGDIVDEAPGTVSYHLTKLASIGLIEEASGQGTDRRERWWRSTHEVTSWESAELLSDPEALAASTALQRSVVQHYAASLHAYLDALPSSPKEWVAAAASSDRNLNLTVTELAELRDELAQLVAKYQEKSAQDRDGAEHITVIYQAFRTP